MDEKEILPLVSGHLSLDFVNTELVRRNVRHDLLLDLEDLALWTQEIATNGTLQHEQMKWEIKDWPEDWFRKVKDFRKRIRNGFEQIATGQQLPVGFKDAMEEQIKLAPFCYKALNGKLLAFPTGVDVDKLLAFIAYDVLKLLTSGELFKLRRCANRECVLLFIDTSGRRKWCSMKICGNRTKVARYQGKVK